MKFPFVLRKTMQVKARKLEDESFKRFLKETNKCLELDRQIEFLRDRLNEQKWYRGKWTDLVEAQNDILRDQCTVLSEIRDALNKGEKK